MQQSPPKQRSPSHQPSQFQQANYIISPSHVREANHITSQDSKIDKLMDVVNHLATTIEHFMKKIDKWENKRQFGVNDIDNVDSQETFFGGLEMESPLCTTLEAGKEVYLRRITNGKVGGPHWKGIDPKPIEVKLVEGENVPQQEEGDRGDCGVYMFMFMEMLALGVEVETC
uniref:Ubiquitin-like protease family profile domain-containing protein n=1 Tax=Lactuca sativa TaxID=4236 RepID=A0A9R1W8S2_LACSA|nr:hypothetical protein LSAT_V11C300107050 [Lactuca sativa]